MRSAWHQTMKDWADRDSRGRDCLNPERLGFKISRKLLGWFRIQLFLFVKGVGAYGQLLTENVRVMDTADRMHR